MNCDGKFLPSITKSKTKILVDNGNPSHLARSFSKPQCSQGFSNHLEPETKLAKVRRFDFAMDRNRLQKMWDATNAKSVNKSASSSQNPLSNKENSNPVELETPHIENDTVGVRQVNLATLPADLGDRMPMSTYHYNHRDEVRRTYI